MKVLLIPVFSFLYIVGFAQTNPSAQILPYTQDFGTTAFSTSKTGMASWTGDGTRPYAAQADAEISLGGSDATISNATPANGGAGGTYGHAPSSNGRLTILTSSNSTNGTQQAVLAINTTAAGNVLINYDLVLTIANTRDIGLALQYRVGTTGNFTTIAGTSVLYNSGTSNGGDADGASDFDNYSVSLPGTALNQPVVQLRWIIWRPSGSGNGSGIGIDNITASVAPPSCTPPSTQATSATITAITNNSMDIGWTNGSGTNALVVVKAGSVVAGTPTSGTAYTANATYGSGQTIASGEYVVYNSTGNSVTVSGLSAGTTYYVAVYSFNTADNCYNNIAPATSSAATTGGGGCPEPAIQAGTITVNASAVSASINWVAGSGSNSLVKLNQVNSFTAPTDGVTYTSNSVYAGGEQVIYNSTGTTMAVTGLTAGTTYYVTVYSFNPCSGTPDYLSTANSVKTFVTLNNSGIPANYYNSATGLFCAPLKTQLRNIINSGFNHQTYSDLWTIYLTGDIQPSELASGNVIWDIYSDNPLGPDPYEFVPGTDQCGSYSGEGGCYNREHSFPQSWFGGGTSAGPGTDYHHIFPTDGYVNGHRSNYVYGRVGTASYTSLNGSKLGSSNWPGISATVFEPINEYKGDVARAFLYMVTCYQNSMPGWETQDINGDIAMDSTTWPSVEPAYLQLMLNWHNSDPVSQKEIDRNNIAYGFQGNRNPFIDHPEYVEMIWASPCSVLPVDIISFTGKYQSGSVVLNWTIANAERFSHFEVESSTDGWNFNHTGSINYFSNQDAYLFRDPVTGIGGDIYYRLKLMEIDGRFRYSNVVKVSVLKSIIAVNIYPNPAVEYLNVTFNKPVTGNRQGSITDLSGRLLMNVTIPAGTVNHKLYISNLSAGIYFLQMPSEEGTIYLRFIKQ